MLRIALALSLLVACGSKTPDAASPTATETTPAETSTESSGAYQDCLDNGPGMLVTREEWAAKAPEEKENECSALTADENMPVEAEMAPDMEN